jgi:hypothetical protein
MISAIKRMAEAQGDFATVLKKGDSVSGAILLIGQIRGANPMLFERYPSFEGQTNWQVLDFTGQNDSSVTHYWQKRCSNDPDLWVLELDVVSAARLDGLLTALN